MLEVLDQKKFFVIRSLSSTNVDLPDRPVRLVLDDRVECIDSEEIILMTVGSRFPAVPTH
jgi:hypothetical protein